MNDKLRKRLIDGIKVISNPMMLIGVIAVMLLTGWLTIGELTPLLVIIAIACLLLSLICRQLTKGLAGQSPD